MAPNRIELKCSGDHDEYPASAALKPGHLVELISTGKVQKHSTYGGSAKYMIAKEDALQGKVITDAFAADDIVPIMLAEPNDWAYVRIPAAAVAIVKGDKLVSNGDGCFVKAVGGSRPLYANTAVSAAIGTSSTAEAAFDKSYTIPANFLKVGDKIRIRAVVKVTASNSTDTLTLRLKIGSTTIVATAAVDVANDDVGLIDAELTIVAIGASGSFIASAMQGLGTFAAATMKPAYLVPTAIDTTATQAITVTGQMSANSSGNSVVLEQLIVECSRVEVPLATAEEAVDNSAGVAEAFLKASFI